MVSVERVVIGAESFPTPHLALPGGADTVGVARFATAQAYAARLLRPDLARVWRTGSADDRVQALHVAYLAAAGWRHDMALRGDARHGANRVAEADRFRTPITDESPNLDQLGVKGRARDGAVWDPGTRTYVGGVDTPASLVAVAYGRAVVARFAAEAPTSDILHNRVTLPDGRTVVGNHLLRGHAARQAGAALAVRFAARGRDASRLENGGRPLYTVTAPAASREVLRHQAFLALACADPGDLGAWWQAAYLLYQAPQYKKGSDAVARVLLVATGTVILGYPPVLPQDIDLRCMVLGQTTATTIPFIEGSTW